MRFFYKMQDSRIKSIIRDVFRSGDYMVTVHYLEKNKVIFQSKHLTDIINRLKRGYHEKDRGLIYVGAADTKTVKLIVNADIAPIELIELLWDIEGCAQINVLVTTSKEGILMIAENLVKGTKKYIVVSKTAKKISRLWREAPAQPSGT